MREEEVALLPKIILITSAIIAYYLFLFCTGKYAKKSCGMDLPFMLKMAFMAAVFAALMIVFRENMRVNIFVTVAYVWSIVWVLYRAKNIFEKG